MADYVAKNGIRYDDYNDAYTIVVCLQRDDEGTGIYNAVGSTVKEYESGDHVAAEQYAYSLLDQISDQASEVVVVSTHKSLFDAFF
jgi:hypothetical protein